MKKITDDEKIYQMFRNCTEPEAARLLAIAQTVVRQRFPEAKGVAPKARKARDPAPISPENSMGLVG